MKKKSYESIYVFLGIYQKSMLIANKFDTQLAQKILDGIYKTFTENWDSKRHLLELSWPI